MDENNEILTSENTEETVITENNIQEAPASAFADELSELEENTVTPVEYGEGSPQENKKHFIQLPVIISLIIVVGVVLGFLVFKCFFNTSVVDTWVIENDAAQSGATADEASEVKVYYTFEDDGVASVSYGTMSYVGEYSVSDNVINLNIQSANLVASFEYSVSGNVFTGRTLTFKDSSYDLDYTFHSVKREIPKLKVDDNFKSSDKITGEWNYFDGYYDLSYTFRSDGTVSLSQNNMLYIDGVYNYTDNTITIKYYADSEQTTDIEYTVTDDALIINGLQYLKVGSASADEARKAFSDLSESNLSE